MAEAGIDVLMRMVGSNHAALQAESRTEFVVNPIIDTLRRDFETGKFCELREFNFAVGAKSTGAPPPHKDASALEREIAAKAEKIRKSLERKEGNRGNLDAVDIQPVEFTRVFDTASTLLFKALVSCDTLDSISIAKRKATGGKNSGEVYLRLDFNKVLITDLEWKDAEHIIEETGTFIYRSVAIRYRPQRSDGSLGPIIPMNWTMKA